MGEANGVERANEALQDALDKAPKSNLSEEMSQKILNQTNANPQSGKISEVFGAGGGTQIKFATPTKWYEKLGLIKEII